MPPPKGVSDAVKVSTQNELLQSVTQYYRAIDNLDFEIVMSKFNKSDSTKYERSGWVPKIGYEEIKIFFTEERKLRGSHNIEQMSYIPEGVKHPDRPKNAPMGKAIFVRGSFNGDNNGNQVKGLIWSDWWVFNNSGKAIYRKSKTSSPGV